MNLMGHPRSLAADAVVPDAAPNHFEGNGLGEARQRGRETVAARARERGFVTPEDLFDCLPEEHLTPEQVKEFRASAEQDSREGGIGVVDGPEGGENRAPDSPRPIRHHALLKNPSYDPVQMYLTEIRRVPLLSAAQEVDLAMRIEAGELAADLLVSIAVTRKVDRKRFRHVIAFVVRVREHQLDPARRLSLEGIGRETVRPDHRPRERAEAVEFLRRVRRDADVARAKLIEANLRLVVSIARRHAPRGMTFLDLAQEGNLGLIRAVQKFDYRRGFKFSTYAHWWIRQAINRAIAEQSRVIRLPVNMTKRITEISRVRSDLVQALGREPVPEEVGTRIGLPAAKVAEVLELSREPLSLEAPIGQEDEGCLGDLIEDHDALVPVEAASMVMLREQIGAVLDSLSDRERKVVELRFGLTDGRPRTLEEVGRQFGLTRERIRQIQAKTLSKVRHPSRPQRLREYLLDPG